MISELTSKVSELQASLSEVESTAQQQLHGLANQSEAAIDNAQKKLAVAHTQVQEYTNLVKVLIF